jgi:Gpi18-like mannosyltransferase
MTYTPIFIRKIFWQKDFLFPAAMWFFSRLFIWSVMLLVAPLLPAPPSGIAATFDWGVFDAWDSEHYRAIVTSGYEYADDGKGHNLAFFPLFPLIVRGVMLIGLPFEVAGTLVNNLAFLGAVYYLYFWVKEYHGSNVARMTTAVATWCPLSMFSTVIYTEGLYLLLSTAALRAFEKKQYGWCALSGAMATATRPTGIALIPGFLIAAWVQRRPPIAYVTAIATAFGLILFSLYCAIQFGDFLGFIHAQRGWRASLGFDWLAWWKMLMQITVGTVNWKHGAIKDPLHPLLFTIIVIISYCLWRFRRQLGVVKVNYGFGFLILLLWLLAGDPLINTVSTLGSAYLLWHFRRQLTPVTVSYGFCGLALLFISGGTWSLSRLVYGIVSISVALGMFLSRHRPWAYFTLFFFAILLATFSVRFSQELWVG